MITQTERGLSQPTREAEQQLEKRLEQFDSWAASEVSTDDDWEANFPDWSGLILEAETVMARGAQSRRGLVLLSRCWAIAAEDETCADWARQHLQQEHVRQMVRQLTGSADLRTRGQACDVLGSLLVFDAATITVLETALEDNDPYVRHRAFLALTCHLGSIDPQPYVKQMLSDLDSYNRYVAVSRYDPQFIPAALQDQIQAVAQDPEVARLLAGDGQ